MGENRTTFRGLVDKPEGKNHLDDLSTGGRTMLLWILKKEDGKVWVGFVWLRIGTSGGLLRIR
jgi:hypothetical protein